MMKLKHQAVARQPGRKRYHESVTGFHRCAPRFHNAHEALRPLTRTACPAECVVKMQLLCRIVERTNRTNAFRHMAGFGILHHTNNHVNLSVGVIDGVEDMRLQSLRNDR